MGSESTNPQIIGLTGSFGSGCSYIAEHILSHMGYTWLSLSKCLKDGFRSAKGVDHESGIPRRELQDFGDQLREKHGGDHLAKHLCEKTLADEQSGFDAKWIMDSIRNPEEIHYLRQFSSNFFLFGVYATRERRWERVRSRYRDNYREFLEDDDRDTGRRSPGNGQRVEDCFAEADVVFSNDEDYAAPGNERFRRLADKVKAHEESISAPLSKRQPTKDECLMASAYTVSQRSSCIKRKVGAVIVDGWGDIISSGFNEVPREKQTCQKEYGKCGRDRVREELENSLRGQLSGLNNSRVQAVLDEVLRTYRMLDHCHALHAEENAIIGLARNGRSTPLYECTLYTTTYPCRLCANKIANLGIREVVYLEPYPDPEAKAILSAAGVEDKFFEGITFKAYSRIYGEKK